MNDTTQDLEALTEGIYDDLDSIVSDPQFTDEQVRSVLTDLVQTVQASLDSL